MKWSQKIDEEIKCAFAKEARKMEAKDELYNQIRQEIYMRRGEKEMKSRRLGKKIIWVGLCTILLTTGTVLAGKISEWDMKLLSFYGEVPTKKQIKEESNFSPKFVDELPGGYHFMMASTHKGELIDTNNCVTDEGNELVLRYYPPEEEEGHAIAFFATDIEVEEYMEQEGRIKMTIVEENGVKFRFMDWTVKYVPQGYEMTEEEEKRIEEEEGEFFITETDEEYYLSLGVDCTQQLSWIDDGIAYTLLSANGYEFSKEEFIEMAKVIINSEE